jgi:hypothetical protein
MAFGDGHASEEGLGPGISDVLKSFKDKDASKKPTKPAPKPPTKPGGQFADAPYSMGSDAGAGASAAPASGGVDA